MQAYGSVLPQDACLLSATTVEKASTSTNARLLIEHAMPAHKFGSLENQN
jgi:hypothetical protein